MDNSNIKLIQWNIRSAKQNKCNLELLVENHKPTIIALQETYLDNEINFNMTNYSIERKDRNTRGGGVLIAIDKRYPYNIIKIESELEVIGINIILKGNNFSIVNIYIPPDHNLKEQELINISNQIEKNFLMVGDFNSHNPLWYSNNLNKKGEVIERWIERLNLIVLNKNENTYYGHQINKPSKIDLAITNLHNSLEWKWNAGEELFGSDHLPIILLSESNQPSYSSKTHKMKTNYRNRNYKELNKLPKLNEVKGGNIEDLNKSITSYLNSSTAPPPKRVSKKRNRNAWFNEECLEIVKQRKKAFATFKKYPTTKNWISYKKVNAQSKQIITTAKRNSFKEYISNLQKIPSNKELWTEIKKIQNKKPSQHKIMLKENDISITEEKEIANVFASYFQEISNPQFLTGNRKNAVSEKKVIVDLNEMTDSYNKEFSYMELDNALKLTNDSAPGEDKVTYKMIRGLSLINKAPLLELYNKIWKEGYVPREWNYSIVLPILKAGKDKANKGSYRPIALTSVMSKTLEKMVKNRLLWALKDLEDDIQTGFKRNFNAYDSIIKIEASIRRSLLVNSYCIAVFFDIEKAYDTLNIQELIKKISESNIKGRLLKYLINFLTNRCFKVKINEETSEIKTLKCGIPQGTILSPPLFNLMLNDIKREINENNITIYADDICIWESNENIEEAFNSIQQKVNKIINWMNLNGFKISKDKTKYMIFTNRRKNKFENKIVIHGQYIEQVQKYKYLGMILDNKLKWNDHVNYVIERCKRRMFILKYVANTKWGTTKELIIKIYEAVIRSIIDYGIFIYYSNTSETNKTKIKRIQFEAIRIATGALKSTSTLLLEGGSGMLPFEFRCDRLAAKFAIRRISIANHPTGKEISSYHEHKFYNYRNVPQPSYGKLRKNIEKYGIDAGKIEKYNFFYVCNEGIEMKFDLSLKRFEKNKCIKEEVQQSYLEKLNIYKNQRYRIWATDGSKKETGVGSGIISDNNKYKFKLPNHSQIYTAEIFAIFKTIDMITKMNIPKSVIITDSLSSIHGIKNFNQDHYLVNRILQLSGNNLEIILFWVPGHLDLMENEKADKVAKEAANFGLEQKLGYSNKEAMCIIKSNIWNEWRGRWREINMSTSKINPEAKKIYWTNNLNRREEVVIHRLIFNNPLYKFGQFFIPDTDILRCECGVRQKMNHLLTCLTYRERVEKFKLEIQWNHDKLLTVEELLREENFNPKFLNFLKDVKIYDKI